MKRYIILISTFLAGFLLYSGWAGFVEDEFKITEYRGQVVHKVRSEQVLDMGTALMTKPLYKIVFSTGKVLTVPYPIYQKLNIGDYTILLAQKDRIIIPK
jgi:hypothetical protein